LDLLSLVLVFYGLTSYEEGDYAQDYRDAVIYLIRAQLYINEVGLGTVFGILMGPHIANALDPRSWGTSSNAITLEVMRIVLATSLFAAGVELPRAYMVTHVKSLITLVVPTMAIGWVTVAGEEFARLHN
jgi:NhaP-type Na+/H+ or K+/H+ antiporter